jgi:hypothetical protein
MVGIQIQRIITNQIRKEKNSLMNLHEFLRIRHRTWETLISSLASFNWE